MQFYILMVDYGRKGLEAVVNPDLSRRQIVEQFRDLLIEGRNAISFVKFVDGNYICDITADIASEAWAGMDRDQYNAARMQAAE